MLWYACLYIYIYVYAYINKHMCIYIHIHIFWHSFWHILWHSLWHICWHSFWHSIWHLLYIYILACILAFYLAFILSFSLTWALPDLNSDIWRSRLKSGSAHRYLELAVKEATLIKSRDPHLAGGGKKSNRLVVSKLPIVDFMPTWFGDFLGVEWSQPGCHCIYGI